MECPVCQANVDIDTVLIDLHPEGMRVTVYCPFCDVCSRKVLTSSDFKIVQDNY